MCGIVGIIDKGSPVASKLYFGLITLQHRGQDACGISTIEGEEVYFKKNNNLVLNSFTEDDLLGLKGRIGIGHTRYATIGATDLTNVQPLVDDDTKIAIGFNGNITNYFNLKKELEDQGIIFKTTSDCELILHVFTQEYKKTKDVFLASQKIIDILEGAYSIVGIIPNKGLFSIRDPHGIRPLVLGKYSDGYILASESVVIQTLDFQFIRDSSPGEVIFISQDNINIQTKVFNAKEKAHCMFEW
ncbi:MAG: amidophosphoribosyltransferase, partial [archaeon]